MNVKAACFYNSSFCIHHSSFRRRRRCDSNAHGHEARRLSTPLHYHLCDASELTDAIGRMKEELSSIHHSSFVLAEGAGVEPAGVFNSDSFRDCSACPCPTFLELAEALGFEPRMAGLESASVALSLRPLFSSASGRTRTSNAHTRATALQAAAEPLRPLMRNLF
jgi:hypothetical protein